MCFLREMQRKGSISLDGVTVVIEFGLTTTYRLAVFGKDRLHVALTPLLLLLLCSLAARLCMPREMKMLIGRAIKSFRWFKHSLTLMHQRNE